MTTKPKRPRVALGKLHIPSATPLVAAAQVEVPKLTVGVMGSAGGTLDPRVRGLVRKLGREIARRGYVLITGACPGLPQEAVKGAKELKGIVVGVSPALNLEEHVYKYHSPTRGYDAIIYSGSGLMGREIENIRSCDVVIFAGGRSGTLGEFAIAYDEGKIIGLLEKSGGVTDHIREIVSFVTKPTMAAVVGDPDPSKLLDKLEQVYREKLLPLHIEALTGRNPDGDLEA